MPELTLELPQPVLDHLQHLTNLYNAQHHRNLSRDEFLTLHLKELAVQEQLQKLVPDLERQRQDAFTADVEQARERLIAQLDVPGPGGPP